MLTRKTANFFPLPSCYHGAQRLQTKQSAQAVAKMATCHVAKLPSIHPQFWGLAQNPNTLQLNLTLLAKLNNSF